MAESRKGGAFVPMIGWIMMGLAVWFLLSCGIGLVLGAFIRAADAEAAHKRLSTAMKTLAEPQLPAATAGGVGDGYQRGGGV
jgi:hypothetical protein